MRKVVVSNKLIFLCICLVLCLNIDVLANAASNKDSLSVQSTGGITFYDKKKPSIKDNNVSYLPQTGEKESSKIPFLLGSVVLILVIILTGYRVSKLVINKKIEKRK